ncbi:MAG: hypothetical protein JOZ57_01785, partial [Abitibacteriaceae bacterium]|nr:hypothetical protein [Abditibacteriaceae bacterium]
AHAVRPSPATLAALARVDAWHLVTKADAATLIGNTVLKSSQKQNKSFCFYVAMGDGLSHLMLMVRPGEGYRGAAGISTANYEIKPLTGFGDKAVMLIDNQARRGGRSHLVLYLVKGKVRLDLMFDSLRIKPTAATINTFKAIASKAASRLP